MKKICKIIEFMAVIFLLMLIFGCCDCDKYKNDNIKSSLSSENQNDQVKIISPIVEMKENYSNMPSYCRPESYTILKVKNGYVIQLSGGTVLSYNIYNTPEDCQKAIIKEAQDSKKRWIDSGGYDF